MVGQYLSNVEGCYRMMEYDREMMEDIGTSFTVIKPQTEPGVSHDQVAMIKVHQTCYMRNRYGTLTIITFTG